MSTINGFVAKEKVQRFGYRLFRAVSVPMKTYKVVVDALVETSLRGVDTHGIRLIPHYVRAVMLGRVNKKPRFVFKQTSPSTGILDADHGFGIAGGIMAMDYAIRLAKESGIGAISVKHSSHFGAAAIFGLRAAKADMIGLAFTDVDSLVFPYGGKKPYFGTNPMCFAAPIAGEDPFCLDMATTRVPLNKILVYKAAKRSLEQGWAMDSDGNPTTDPNKAVSPLPIGDYKGYGLAAMITILSSMLSGMPFGPHIHAMYPLDKIRRYLGHFLMAIDISRFRELHDFKKEMKMMVEELRLIPGLEKRKRVVVSGDPEKLQFRRRSKKGIPIPDYDKEAFRLIAQELHISLPRWLKNT